jgi:1-acyl-sn-glycerol-3-phosphate acyltransferase
MNPHIESCSPEFPGDPTPQPPFGLCDSIHSSWRWVVGLYQLAMWMIIVKTASGITDIKNMDHLLKLMSKTIPATLGIKVVVRGDKNLTAGPYVYVSNHVNIFDMFVLYQAIPEYTRALEHIDHFSWPFIGPLITAAGQIPVDPRDSRRTARGLKAAAEMLNRGESLTVLPEGSRTLDGSVGAFLPGAFKVAIKTGRPVVPIAIKGGRAISRRGDWRIRPGTEEVLFAVPISTSGLKSTDAPHLAETCRKVVIDLLHGRRVPGN